MEAMIIVAVLTIILEVPFVYFTLGKMVGDKKKLVVNSVLINIITNVSLSMCSIIANMMRASIEILILIPLEMLIVIIEACMYRYATKEVTLKIAMVISFFANLFSCVVGGIILFSVINLLENL